MCARKITNLGLAQCFRGIRILGLAPCRLGEPCPGLYAFHNLKRFPSERCSEHLAPLQSERFNSTSTRGYVFDLACSHNKQHIKSC